MKLNQKQQNFICLVNEATGFAPVPEHRFHQQRKWRFDYAITEVKVAIEVEGGVFSGGRHITGTGFVADLEKYNTAESMGWHILRITPDMLCAPVTIALIRTTVVQCLTKYIVTVWPKELENSASNQVYRDPQKEKIVK